jgi:hypothetical protein
LPNSEDHKSIRHFLRNRPEISDYLPISEDLHLDWSSLAPVPVWPVA